MDNPKVRIKINKHVCAVDKKERYFTNVSRATPIDDETLIKYASDDSGIRIEQIAAVYRSLFVQVRELVCNGHSVQLGDLGVLRFAIHAKISADLEGGGGLPSPRSASVSTLRKSCVRSCRPLAS